MAEDWRVTATFTDEAHVDRAAQAVHEHDVEDDVRHRLAHGVMLSADGPTLYLYADSEDAAREAERVTHKVLAQQQLTAKLTLDRWHPDTEEWEDPSLPMPDAAHTEKAQHQHQVDNETELSRTTGHPAVTVRANLPSHRDAVELAQQLQAKNYPVIRRWKYLFLGASNDDEAAALTKMLKARGPAGTTVHTEPNYYAYFGTRVVRQTVRGVSFPQMVTYFRA
jgi:hypothetical protein